MAPQMRWIFGVSQAGWTAGWKAQISDGQRGKEVLR